MRWLACVPLVLGASGCVDDAAPDPMPEPETGTIRLGTYLAGVEVVAINPDGTAVRAQTAEIGYTEMTVQAGASVVALNPDQLDAPYEVWAILGVQPGDFLSFGSDPGFVLGAETAAMTVTFPSVAGAAGYVAMSYCRTETIAAPATSVTIHQFEGCAPVVASELNLIAHDGNGTLLAHGAIPLGFSSGGTVSLADWDEPTRLRFYARELPPIVTRAEMVATARSYTSSGWSSPASAVTPSDGVVSFITPWADELVENVEARATFITDAGQIQTTVDGLSSATAHSFVDAAELPWITAIAVDVGASTVAVTAEGTRLPDSTWLDVSYLDEPSGLSYRWRVVAPPVTEGSNTFQLPVLPAPFDGINLAERHHPEAVVTLVDDPGRDGYDEVREARPFRSDDPMRFSGWSVPADR
jgi:hypothetical protein